MVMKTAALIGALAGMLSTSIWARTLAPGDPCSLLSESEVSAALGAPVTLSKIGHDAKHCSWEQKGKRGTIVVDVHLLIESAKTFDALKNMMHGGKLTRVPVSGVGDDAYYEVGGRDAPLFAKKGASALRIAVDGKGWSVEDIKSKEKALALALLPKL